MSELILAPDELIEKWNNLPFSNNFIFTKVMQNEELCKKTLELLLNIKIKKLEYTHSEVYFKDSYDSHGIRFDVYTSDDKHCYDIEMQTTNKSNLLKRARFYSSCIDVDTLKQGKDFSQLKENIIIFLCLEDPFKIGLPVYTIKTHCVEKADIGDDETTKVFYNISQLEKHSNINVRNFFNFIKTNIPADDFTEILNKYTFIAKQNADYRRQYMRLEADYVDRLNEGIAQGIAKGIAQGLEQGMQKGLEQGMQKGLEQGREEGILDGKLEAAVNAVNKLNISIEKASEIFEVTLEQLKNVLNQSN